MDKIAQSWIDNANNKGTLLEYENWFDSCSTLKDCVSNGYIDFTHSIFTQDFYNIIGDPRNACCLEIGFGGGRLINAASKFFRRAIGIDILSQASIDKTYEFLKTNNYNENVTLFNRNDVDKIPANSVHFAYSFIVFQHFSSYDEVLFYLELLYKTLNHNGAGIIFFGRNDITSKDIHLVKETEFETRCCSLYLNKDFAKKEVGRYFEVIEVGEKTKRPWSTSKSGQFYIKFRK